MLEHTQLVAFFFASTIGINLLCAAFLYFCGLKQQNLLLTALFFGCLSIAAYQYTSWLYHGSTDVQKSVMLLKVQTGIVLFCIPFYVKIVLDWTEQKVRPACMYIFSFVCMTFFILNLFSDASLRFSGDVSLIQYTILGNEAVSRLTGTPNILMLAVQIIAGLVLLVLAKVVMTCIRQKQTQVAISLGLILVFQVLVSTNAVQMESKNISSIYLGGVPFTALNLFICMAIAHRLNENSDLLKVQVRVRKKLESALAGIAKGVSQTNDNSFFVNMMQELQKLTGAHICCIASIDMANGEGVLTTQALVYRGKPIGTKRLKVNALTQDLLTQKEIVWVSDNLAESHMNITFFKRVNAQSFLSIPMLNDKNELEGKLILMFEEACEKDERLRQILEVFASRAGAELHRSKITQQLHSMAYFDYQTQLPNAGSVNEIIDRRYRENLSAKADSILIMFELHRFTDVNRQFGFKYSELAVKTLGERFKHYALDGITIARLSADQFVCIVDDSEPDAEGVMHLHWEALQLLVRKPISVGEFVIRLDCRAGGVVFPLQTDNSKEVLRCAEIALSDAQQKHSKKLSCFNQQSLELVDRKELLLKLLEPALDRGSELYAEYQPKVNKSGTICGCEALIRWKNSDIGMVSPSEFISLAEESSLVEQLGVWMLQEVCKQIAEWHKQSVPLNFRVAINVSPFQIAQDEFVSDFMEVLLQHDISPKLIEIELTETSLLTNMKECVAKLKKLRSIGVNIALDDFGTGYSSLSYINELPLDVIKIDRSFVMNLHKKNTLELAKAIVTLSHHMNVKVVAEGTETEEQIEILKQMDCDFYQGFYFSPALSPEDFANKLRMQQSSIEKHEL